MTPEVSPRQRRGRRLRGHDAVTVQQGRSENPEKNKNVPPSLIARPVMPLLHESEKRQHAPLSTRLSARRMKR